MNPLNTLTSVSVPLDAERPSLWAVPWTRLLPLWRYVVFLAALFVVLTVHVFIRVDVQRLQVDLDRNDRAQRAAEVLNERLTLELEARRRLQAVETWSATLGAEAETPVVHIAPDVPALDAPEALCARGQTSSEDCTARLEVLE